MGGKQSRQDRKGGPSLEEVATARRHKQETEGNLRSTSSGVSSLAEQPPLPPPPPPGREDNGLKGALKGAEATAEHLQEQVGEGSRFEAPHPLPGHSHETQLTREDAIMLSDAAIKAEKARTQDNRPYFGPASPAEPFVPMAPDNLYPRKYFERGQLHIVNEGHASAHGPEQQPEERLLYAGVPNLTGDPAGPSEPRTAEHERAMRYIETAADPTYNPLLRAKQAASEAMPHPGPPPFLDPEHADPNAPETSVYFEHGQKHVVHHGVDEVVPLHGPARAPPSDQKRTPLSPLASMEKQWGPDLPPKDKRVDPGPDADKMEANKHAKGTAHVAETVSNQALKAVHAGEKARNFGQEVKNEVKELAQEPEPPPMAPEAALEKETMPQTDKPDLTETATHSESQAAQRPAGERQNWEVPMTPEADLFLQLQSRWAGETLAEVQPAPAQEPAGAETPSQSSQEPGGIIQSIVSGLADGFQKLLGGDEKEGDTAQERSDLTPADTPCPGDESKPSPKKEQAEKQSQQEPVKKNQKATAGQESSVDSTQDPSQSRIERPGIVIGPSQEGGPCLGPASGAEEVADRLRAASPFEPISRLVAHSPVENPPHHIHRAPSGVIVCSETGWSGSHPAHAAVPDQAGRTGAPIGPALPEHDHPMFGTDLVGGPPVVDVLEATELLSEDRAIAAAAQSAEAAGASATAVPAAGDVAFAAATSGALGMDDTSLPFVFMENVPQQPSVPEKAPPSM